MKRGLLVILVIILLSNIVYADFLNLNLTTTKIGSSTPFEGILSFQFSEYKPLNSLMSFFVGSSQTDISLSQIINNTNITGTIVPPSYNTTGGSLQTATVNFVSGGSKTEVGIDFRGTTIPRDPEQLTLIGDFFSFDVSPTSGNPKDLNIYLGGQTIYKYRGQPTGWTALDPTNYLSGQADGNTFIYGGDFFCQLVNVKGSNEYLIKTLIKRDAAGSDINVSMLDGDSDLIKPDCADPKTPCCQLTPLNDFSEVNCTLSKIITEPTNQYLCIYPSSDDSNTAFFKIKIDNDKPSLAFANGANLSESNFEIYGAYRTYNNTLNRKTSVLIPIKYLDDYIHENTCNMNCLLVPLNISLSNSASIALSNLSLKYQYDIQREENSFKKLSYIPESVSYDNNISLSLIKLNNVLSPISLGSSNIYVQFSGLKSNSIIFQVVPAPKAFIRYGPFNPEVNEEITFDASGSKSASNNITSYLWNFGDETTGSSISLKHSYVQNGNYTIILKVIDSEGIYGIDIVSINIENGTGTDLGSLINQTSDTISLLKKNLESNPLEVKDTANILGLNNKLNNFESNLTSIKNNYNNILNGNLTDIQKNEGIKNLLNQVNNIKNNIPIKFNVDSASFSGKVTGLNQITSCCEFTTDINKRKFLAAQDSINVNGDARTVNIAYVDGRTESFMIIKKDISGGSGKVYEFVPFGVTISPENVLSGGQPTASAPNVYSFASTIQLIYKVENIGLNQALQTRTAVLPTNLENIQVNQSTPIEITPSPSVCGNRICESDEDSNSCPKDCVQSNNLLFIIPGIVIIIIVLLFYFGFFFKGGLFRKKPKFTHLETKNLFKTEKDHTSVKDYIEHSLKAGLTEDKIRVVLKSKGWNDLQINSVINEVKSHKEQPKTQVKSINQNIKH